MPSIYNEQVGEILRSPEGDQVPGSSSNVVIPVGGNSGQLQYNANGTFGGVPTTSYANGILNLGPIANVNFGGGLGGQYLKRDPNGSLVWGNVDTINGQPSIHWAVSQDGNSQQFVDGNLINFLNNNYVSLFRNGLLVETDNYSIIDNTLTVNVQLYSGDDLDILAVPVSAINGAGGGTVTSVNVVGGSGITATGGPVTTSGVITVTNTGVTSLVAGKNISVSASNGAVTVQADTTAQSGQLMYSNGGTFSGVPNTGWDNTKLTLGSDSTLKIGGGTSGYFLQTDGLGNLAWAEGGNGGNGTPGGSNRFVQYNDNGVFGGDADFTYDENTNTLQVTNITVPGNVDLSTSDIVRLGTINNLKIIGGANGQFLRTDGTGNLVFAGVTGNGTVTSVGGTGTGLGFVLSGTVTTSGNLTLTIPTAAQLRTNMNIGNIANINFNGNGSTVLNGNGQWMTVGGGGTVTRVSGDGSGLGFTLSGDVITQGNLSLAVPTVSQLRTTLGMGNVANVNLNGSQLQYLRGDGAWASVSAQPGGDNYTLQYNNDGVFAGSANIVLDANLNTLYTPTLVANTQIKTPQLTNIPQSQTLSVVNSGTGQLEIVTIGGGNIDIRGNAISSSNVNIGSTIDKINLQGVTQIATVGNLKIGGGVSGYFLRTDGAGNLAWAAAAGGNGVPGGANTQIQYNDSGAFGGSAAFTFNEVSNTVAITNLTAGGNVSFTGSSVSLGSNSSVKITGGSSGQVLSTNGSGNLSWVNTSTGTVSSVTGNGSGLGFTLGGTVTTTGNIALTTPTAAQLRTNLTIGNVANLNLNGNSSTVLNGVGSWVQSGNGSVTSVGGNGTGLGFTLSGTVTSTGNLVLAVPTASALRTSLTIGNVANANLVGNTELYLNGNGQWTQPTISTAVLANITYGTENVQFSPGSGGTTVPVYVIDGSICYASTTATTDYVLNIRGNSQVTLNSLLPYSKSLSVTYVITTGATAYSVTGITIDGVSVPIKWAEGYRSGIPNSILAYTFTIIKTGGTSNYLVLGNMTRFA